MPEAAPEAAVPEAVPEPAALAEAAPEDVAWAAADAGAVAAVVAACHGAVVAFVRLKPPQLLTEANSQGRVELVNPAYLLFAAQRLGI